jgi:drug/metabolite transporter (DMT)-like permease
MSNLGMDSNLIGMASAIATSWLWTFGVLLFASACKRMGAFSVNAYRIALAACLLVVTNLLIMGAPFLVATSGQWVWLTLSGIVGFGLGDIALFEAFVTAGPRLSALVFSTSAIFSTLGAYVLLGESIQLFGFIGIGITLAGIAIAVSGKGEFKNGTDGKPKIWGLVFAALGAIGQGMGAVLSKTGMLGEQSAVLNPISAALMRILAGTVFIWVLGLVFRKVITPRNFLRNEGAVTQIVLATIVGPFLGMTFSMVAIANTQTGIAQTLMSLMPILLIPADWMLNREKPNLHRILGAIMTVGGITILFLTR